MKLISLLFVVLSFSASAQIVNIPDANFKTALLNHSPVIDINGDGQIQNSEAATVIVLEVGYKNISNLTGIQSFTSLTTLNCASNQLTTLNVSGMANLLTLFCFNNQLTNLNVLGTNLRTLQCHENNLVSLNLTGLNNLLILKCHTNNLASLNLSNLSSLSDVDCHQNNLTTLTLTGCNSLTKLTANLNQLTTINVSNLQNLDNLQCGANNLTTLTAINCTSLKSIGAHNNQLQTVNLGAGLPNLLNLHVGNNNLSTLNINNCPNLWDLQCGGNQLTSLNVSQLPSLSSLSCSMNQLTTLDISKNRVYYLAAGMNPLTFINAKNGSRSVLDIDVQNTPTLEYICTDDNEIADLQLRLLNEFNYHTNVGSYCTVEPASPYSSISGTIKIDINHNGCDAGDPFAPGKMVKLLQGTQISYTATNDTGSFIFYAGQGDYTASVPITNAHFTSAPNSFPVYLYNNSQATVNFCLVPNGVHNDLESTVLPVTPARPGFNASYHVFYRNKGNTVQSGTVQLQYDAGKLQMLSALPAVNSQAAGLLTWAYSDLQPFESRSVIVNFNILPPPVNNNGDTLQFVSRAISGAADETPSDNNFVFKQVLTGSFDPNDKTALQGKNVSITQAGEYLHYMIRFQNMGTDTAFNVVVKDILGANFQVNTVELMTSSHPFTFKQVQNKLEFFFKGIKLPAQSVNNAGSNGFISFKVKTAGTMQPGDSVQNNASIFFDYNFPVVTNNAVTHFNTQTNVPIPPPPVSTILEYFNGVKENNDHLLTWKINTTSTEVTFDIERGVDTLNFSSIKTIVASKVRCLLLFEFLDEHSLTGSNFYRIKITDAGGNVSFSNIIELVKNSTAVSFEIINVSPVPVTNGTANLNVNSPANQTAVIQITDATGKTIQSLSQLLVEGKNSIQLNVSKLLTGIYTIAVYNETGIRKTLRFLKQ